MKYLRRLYWITDTRVVNPLVYPFLFATFAYGVGFTVFEQTDATSNSSLHTAMEATASWFPFVWGCTALLVIVLTIGSLLIRKTHLAMAGAGMGILLWLYANSVYVITHNWLVLFSVAMPNLFFWVWYASRARVYHEAFKDMPL